MRTLLVDDEAAARGYLKDMLTAHPEIQVMAEARDGLEAIEKINRLRPDLVFLDVQMPVLDGFAVLPYLKHRPLIIFCTAFDQYALRAFEVSALDYLLKPPEPARLAKSLEKARDEWGKLERLGEQVKPAGPRNIVVHKHNKYQVLWLRDIHMFIKEGRYTSAVVDDNQRFLTDLSLDKLAKDIVDPSFMRVSRSAIIRKEFISTFAVKSFGTGEIVTRIGERIAVSRGRLRDFKTWFFGA